MWRRNRGVVIVVLALSLTRVAYLARYWNPDGDAAWGPRYLLPLCPLLALGIGELVERGKAIGRPARRTLSAALAALALVGTTVTLASLWVPYTYAWAVMDNTAAWQQVSPAQANEVKKLNLTRHYIDWRSSPIVVNLSSLDAAGRYPPGFPLHWWRGGGSVARPSVP